MNWGTSAASQDIRFPGGNMVILFAEREVGIPRPWPLHRLLRWTSSRRSDRVTHWLKCYRADGGNEVVYSLRVDIK